MLIDRVLLKKLKKERKILQKFNGFVLDLLTFFLNCGILSISFLWGMLGVIGIITIVIDGVEKSDVMIIFPLLTPAAIYLFNFAFEEKIFDFNKHKRHELVLDFLLRVKAKLTKDEYVKLHNYVERNNGFYCEVISFLEKIEGEIILKEKKEKENEIMKTILEENKKKEILAKMLKECD